MFKQAPGPTDGRCMPVTGARGTSGYCEYVRFDIDAMSKRARGQRMNDARHRRSTHLRVLRIRTI